MLVPFQSAVPRSGTKNVWFPAVFPQSTDKTPLSAHLWRDEGIKEEIGCRVKFVMTRYLKLEPSRAAYYTGRHKRQE